MHGIGSSCSVRGTPRVLKGDRIYVHCGMYGFCVQSIAEGIGTVMRITVASGVILILLSLGKRMAPGLLDIGCLEAKSAPICMMLAPVL